MKRVRVSPDREHEARIFYQSNFIMVPVEGGVLHGSRMQLPDVTIEVDPTAPMGTMEEVAS